MFFNRISPAEHMRRVRERDRLSLRERAERGITRVQKRIIRVRRGMENILSALGIPPFCLKNRDRIGVHVFGSARHWSPEGDLLWAAKDLPNLWHDEGEQHILSACFATTMTNWGAPTANDYIGLDARGAPAEADTLASLSGEPSGSGYAREALSTAGTGVSGQDFYIHQPAAYYVAETKTVTFTASGGDWSAVTQSFLCSHVSATSSGNGQRLYCTLALSASRTITDGDSLDVDMTIGISE